jgi:hypothetical protein
MNLRIIHHRDTEKHRGPQRGVFLGMAFCKVRSILFGRRLFSLWFSVSLCASVVSCR